MADFGLVTIPTHLTIPPAELGRWAEDHGFESVWFGEHTHIPASRKTPFPLGGELPEYYKQFFDPFIGLTAAAAVTKKLKVGTSVCLVPEHHPITLAKTIACLDRVSDGRFLFGIGAGWNAEEMADHGVAFKDRWKVTRERVLAMRERGGGVSRAICECRPPVVLAEAGSGGRPARADRGNVQVGDQAYRGVRRRLDSVRRGI